MNVSSFSFALLGCAAAAFAQLAPSDLEHVAVRNFRAQRMDRVAGVSDNQGITHSEIIRQMVPIIGQVKAESKSAADFDLALEKIFQDTLKSTIDSKLIVAEFRASGNKVPASFIDAEIEETVRRDFAGDRNRFVDQLRKEGTTPLEYRKIVEEHIIASEMQRDIRTNAMTTGPGKLAEYYEKHKAEFERKEQIRFRQITITQGSAESVEEARTRANAWADALQHPEKILTTFARFKIDTNKLNAKPTFADIAERISTDDYAKTGGDSGWRELGDLNEKIVTTVKNLPANQASAPMEFTISGNAATWFIFVRTDYRPKGYLPLSDPEVLGDIERKVNVENFRQALATRMAELRAKHYVTTLGPEPKK